MSARRIAPQHGLALELAAGDVLVVTDPEGGQVADVYAVRADDVRERYSGGRTIDYNETIRPTTGHALWSNRSTRLLEIVRDDSGEHDVLLTPCSGRMFELLRGVSGHPSCHGNVAAALAPYGVDPDSIETTFNAFMRVPVTAAGAVSVEAPRTRAGDAIAFRALVPVVVAVTACSSEHSNGGVCKPIDVEVLAAG